MNGRDDADGPSRRELLTAGAGALATAGSASLSGCTAAMPPLGQEIRYGRVDVPPADDPAYRRWVPPVDTQSERRQPLWQDLMYTTPRRTGSDSVDRVHVGRGFLKSSMDYFGIGYDNYDRVIGNFGTLVAEVDVDRSTVDETLLGSGYERRGTYDGYDCYGRSDLPRTVAVGDEALVFSRSSSHETDVRRIIDTGAGRTEPRHAHDEQFAQLTAAAGAHPFTWLGVPMPYDWDAPETGALTMAYDDSAAYFVHYLLFPADEVPTVSRIKEQMTEVQRAVDAYSVDVTLDGNLATIEMHQPLERYFQDLDANRLNPQVTWGVDHDTDAGTVTLRHEAGDAVDADLLTVYVDEANRSRDPADTQFADEYGTVTPGDSLTVEVGGLDEFVRLVFESADGDSSMWLVDYDLDGPDE
ncbi:hypothetical protein [Haloarchaeobius iranensis]|uniref:Uncharacterized protein n=1 Tax=Haloarchaeobius iranensis TaxID=996166 RepID=A0A1H0AJA1_9EURY|nr:hypothetical protein [Haloarchaeobius iranensis]SDN33193.1 hypothetical protein SAMN05192554_12731 [Haloarchaeobius iranensis]